MLNLSYAKSPKLNVTLDKIDHDRVKILTTPLNKFTERKLSWRAKLDRSYYSLSLSGNTLKKKQIAKLVSTLTPIETHKLSKQEREYLLYSQAQDHITNEWYVSDKYVETEDVYSLYKISSQPIFGDSLLNFKAKNDEIKAVLTYLSSGDDHPVIKAGIIQMQIRLLSPFKTANGRITRLLSQLYLYKDDYDMRSMLVLDEYWKNNLNRYKQEVEVADKSNNMTPWLEYFAEAVSEQTEKVLRTIRSDRKVIGVSKAFWSLNKRQKQIVNILENPKQSIRNEDVQNLFSVSQITASRDLAKLYKLGILLRQGNGRSVYYTKV